MNSNKKEPVNDDETIRKLKEYLTKKYLERKGWRKPGRGSNQGSLSIDRLTGRNLS